VFASEFNLFQVSRLWPQLISNCSYLIASLRDADKRPSMSVSYLLFITTRKRAIIGQKQVLLKMATLNAVKNDNCWGESIYWSTFHDLFCFPRLYRSHHVLYRLIDSINRSVHSLLSRNAKLKYSKP
jgi:hypothetical protein